MKCAQQFCSLMIESWEELGLKVELHPKSYDVVWMINTNLRVDNCCFVILSVNNFTNTVMCEVLYKSCDILLGTHGFGIVMYSMHDVPTLLHICQVQHHLLSYFCFYMPTLMFGSSLCWLSLFHSSVVFSVMFQIWLSRVLSVEENWNWISLQNMVGPV